jgi:hypothetical protein
MPPEPVSAHATSGETPASATTAGSSTEDEISAELAVEEPTQEVVDEIRARAEAQAGITRETAFGEVGKPFDRRGPFLVGFLGALGVACALALAWTFVAAGQVLVLLGLAFFIAVGLEP